MIQQGTGSTEAGRKKQKNQESEGGKGLIDSGIRKKFY
jgi:hypothetical protein